MRRCAVIIALLVAFPASAFAQRVAAGDPAEDDARLAQLVGAAPPGSFAIRPAAPALLPADSALPLWARWLGSARSRAAGPFTITPFDPTLRLYANSAVPWGQNDGAVWAGKGLTAALDIGGEARWGGLRLTLRPLLIHEGNAAFALPRAPDTVPTAYSKFAYPYHRFGNSLGIDWPIRFGPAAYWVLDPGQTSLRYTGGRLEAGAGWENMWWGPGRYNAIIMSDNAPGFPHAWLATPRPLSVGIGAIEWQWFWGRLRESQYFDTLRTNGTRFVTGMAGTFQPKGFPGLYVGATRLFYEELPPGGLSWRDYLLVFDAITKTSVASSGNPSGNDQRDQVLSLFARWLLPASGFEAYFEWARNDHNGTTRDLILEPEHSQAYTLGFQQARPLEGGRLLVLGGELTHLERPVTQTFRETPTYYVHYLVTQGFTQDGQVVGAGAGPGGDAQHVDLALLLPGGRVSLGFVRQVHDNDVLHDRYPSFAQRADSAGVLAFLKHDVTYGATLGAQLFRGDWLAAASLSLLREDNRYWVYLNDLTNLNVTLTVRRRLGR